MSQVRRCEPAGQQRERRPARGSLPLSAPALVSVNEEMPTPDPTACREPSTGLAVLEPRRSRTTLSPASSAQRLSSVMKARTDPCPSDLARDLHRGRHPSSVILETKTLRKLSTGTSLVVQWLRICFCKAEDAGSIPGSRTRIPHATG